MFARQKQLWQGRKIICESKNKSVLDLVLKLAVERKLVLWFPIGHFVHPEPVDGGLQVAGFQPPDITDV